MMQYSTADDRAAEDRLARQIEQLHPGHTLHRYSEFDRVDWWVEHRQRCVAFVETKDRKVSSTKYPTLFLSFQKWLSMFLSWAASGIPNYFVVGYTDVQMFIDIADVDARKTVIAGRNDRGNVVNAREPIIEIPISQLRPISMLFGRAVETIPVFEERTQAVSSRMADIFDHDSDAPWHRRQDEY